VATETRSTRAPRWRHALSYEIVARELRRVRPCSVTITRVGRLTFNASAYDRVQAGGGSVLLLWDVAAQRIGIQPCGGDDRAFVVYPHRQGRSAGFMVRRFFDQIGYPYRQGTRRFPVVWNAALGLFEFPLIPTDARAGDTP
jgi:hypothetical protein